MEYMDEDDYEEISLDPFPDSEDDTSPPEKRLKHDLALPKRDRWARLFNFESYATRPSSQVFKDMVIRSKKDIKAGKKAYNVARTLYQNNLKDLEKKQPCKQTTTVLQAILRGQNVVKNDFLMAEKLLPVFEEDIKKFLQYRESSLLELHDAKNRYYEKVQQLVEIPKIDKMMMMLACKVEGYESIEQESGLTPSDIDYIIYFLQREKGVVIDTQSMVDKEQFDMTEMKNLLIGYKDSLEKLHSLGSVMETAEAKVKKHVRKHSVQVTIRVDNFVGCLRSGDTFGRILRGQLELLCQKNVIHDGYDEDFFEDWYDVNRLRFGTD